MAQWMPETKIIIRKISIINIFLIYYFQLVMRYNWVIKQKKCEVKGNYHFSLFVLTFCIRKILKLIVLTRFSDFFFFNMADIFNVTKTLISFVSYHFQLTVIFHFPFQIQWKILIFVCLMGFKMVTLRKFGK